MKQADIRYQLGGMAAAVFAYVLFMWGLVLFLFIFAKEVPAFPRFNVLSPATMLPLGIGSLLPVFAAEKLLCRRLVLPWILVRLATPCIGSILFLAILMVVYPVLLQNMFIMFPVIFFVLIQSGALLISICFTAILRSIRKSREKSLEMDFSTDPKLRPIKLSPFMEQRTLRMDPQTSVPRKTNWKSSMIAAALVAFVIGSMLAMLLWFPSYRMALMFMPAVTQADIETQIGQWNGRRAAEDIPRLTALSQLEDGTFDGLTYLTVETDRLIPLSYYELKDTSDSHGLGSYGHTRRRRRRSLPIHTNFAGVNAMYYGQYCLVELEDGSYIGAFLDSSYRTALGRVQLPIGQIRTASNVESELLMEAAGTYSVPTEYLLMMHDNSYYETIKILDHGIRLVAVASVPVISFCLALLWVRKKKRHG